MNHTNYNVFKTVYNLWYYSKNELLIKSSQVFRKFVLVHILLKICVRRYLGQ